MGVAAGGDHGGDGNAMRSSSSPVTRVVQGYVLDVMVRSFLVRERGYCSALVLPWNPLRCRCVFCGG